MKNNPLISQQFPFVVHFNLQNCRWFNTMINVKYLSCKIYLAFTPNQLAQSGGIAYVADQFRKWKAQNHAFNVYLHLDHAIDPELCLRAIYLGFDSVMFDGAKLPFEDNQRLTAKIVGIAHQNNVLVEAELGQLNYQHYVKTLPSQVKTFTINTQVDYLAVAIGNYHGLHSQPAQLDLELLKKLQTVSQAQLVLHGASGLALITLKKLVKNQLIAKINFDSDLQKTFLNHWNEISDFSYSNHYQHALAGVQKFIHETINTLLRETKDAKTTHCN